MEKLKKHLPLISAILAVVAFLMLFVPVILNVWDPEFGTHTFFGFESVFGTHKDFYGTTVHVLRYSFWNLLSYLLVVYVAVFGFVCRKKVNAKLGIFTGVCALAAGIIFFLVLQTTFFANQGVTGALIGPGAIVAGVCSILSCAAIVWASILRIKANRMAKKAKAEQTQEEIIEETVEETIEEATEEVVEAAEETAEEVVEETTEEVTEEATDDIVEEIIEE